MTLNECIKKKIVRVRLNVWADPNTYLKIPIYKNGKTGPWYKLYERGTQEICDMPTPIGILSYQFSLDKDEYEEYTGKLDRDDTYDFIGEKP